MLALVKKNFFFYFTNFAFLLNILKIKSLTLTFKETNGTSVIKTVRNSLTYIRSIEYGYILSAILHLSHRGKKTLSKLMTL